MRRRAALVLLLLTFACTDGDPAPSPTQPAALTADQQELARLASRAAAVHYDATYVFDTPSTEPGTLRIVAAPPSYRVEIKGGTTTATYLDVDGRKVACTARGSEKAICFLVARPGEKAPEQFDPAIQRIFSDAVGDLAVHPGSYGVTRLPSASPTSGPLPAAACFQVQHVVESAAPPGTTGADVGFETGRYCFAESGVMTSVALTTGSLELSKVSLDVPASAFSPPASPATLPTLSPGPSAT